MSRKGVKHKTDENTIKGVTYVEGVNVGYDVSVGRLTITNVGFRSLRDVRRQLIEKGYKSGDITEKRHVTPREKAVY